MTTTSRCLAIANIGHRFGLADFSLESSWFAARKLSRGSALEEVASLRDIVESMKTQKSTAAIKHLDDRIKVWMRRYSKQDPRDVAIGVPEFSSKSGGGSGGVGVVKQFAQQIWDELAK